MSNEIEYKDLIAFHPGSYVEEIVEDLNITQAEFAARLEVSPKTISKIINGKENITSSIANKLSKVTGISIKTWLNLQANFDSKIEEIENEKNQNEKKVCNCINFSYLESNGYIAKKRYKLKQKIEVLHKLLNLSNLTRLEDFNAAVSYRRSTSTNERKSIICSNVMLELATNNARNKTANKYNRDKLLKILPTIKKMILEDPDLFYPKLKKLLLTCGIVLEALPNLPGARLNGATKKFKNGSVLLLITDKNKYADIFWFSLVHELGHIYYEDFYSGYKDKNQYQEKERKADQFATDFFISQKEYKSYVSEGIFTSRTIKTFAKKTKVSAGIVVGRLQSDGLINFSQFNKLRDKYEISLNTSKG